MDVNVTDQSTFKTCQSLQHPSKSSTQHAILEWWSTVD